MRQVLVTKARDYGQHASLVITLSVELIILRRRHPDDQSSNFNSVQHWIDLAKLLEDGKFHGMFIADVLGGYDVYGGPKNLKPAIQSGAQWPVNEPVAMVAAMAAATQSLGIGVTISTSYEQPYHLARRMSTVDHLTGGW
jgi:alkanesulfonate monooxygenase SsuD/methylene tetrahydromethanopterin reductase-like flavin-dependent oxidoreductase (luciferase family)